ncbi:hypothetical protein [Deinococcus depolymerans]|uniref:hypothetical protein n=1 Tax=Deinococcus depolymerans TaxID=392408 RepID=UPI0031DE556C
MQDKLNVIKHQGFQVVIGGLDRPTVFRYRVDEYRVWHEGVPRKVEVWHQPTLRLNVRVSRVDVESGTWDATLWP